MDSRAAVQLQAANQAANDSRCSLTSSGTKIDMHNSKVGPIENSPESAVSDGAALVPRDRGGEELAGESWRVEESALRVRAFG